jgi:sulfatase modifying factor 1
MRGMASAIISTAVMVMISSVTYAEQADPSASDPPAAGEFVFVKGGCFEMGDVFLDGFDNEKPVHEVCVDDFYMGKYEITQRQWKEIMVNNPSYFTDCGSDCPVERVSWDDVQVFLAELNKKTGRKYRLPTEAEWEYACREGGKKVRFGTGSDRISPEALNFDADKEYKQEYSDSGKSLGRPAAVGSYKPNSLGLYDMSGNVWEWVQDKFSVEAYAHHVKDNPIYKEEEGSFRVRRGGSWNSTPWSPRCSYRYGFKHDRSIFDLGFRLVRSK